MLVFTKSMFFPNVKIAENVLKTNFILYLQPSKLILYFENKISFDKQSAYRTVNHIR